MKFDFKKFFMKFDRFCAWLLVAIMAIFIISGYGMTKGVISAEFSKWLHETLLPVPGTVAFAFHSAYGMHISFKRWKCWGRIPLIILTVYGTALVLGVIIFEYMLKVPGASAPQSIDL